VSNQNIRHVILKDGHRGHRSHQWQYHSHSVAGRQPARSASRTGQHVRVPRIASGTAAGFVAEGAQISDGDVANALDAALWDGTGTTNTVTGTLDLAAPDSLIDGLATAQGNHVTPTHWVMTSASFAGLRKLKVGAGDARYLFDPATIQNGTELRLLGLPVILTDNIANTGTAPGKARVALVDFSKVVVARDVNAEVKILDQTGGDFDSIGIRVVSRWDTALLQPKAGTLLTAA
jgi:HK97 family phage major capsid protein